MGLGIRRLIKNKMKKLKYIIPIVLLGVAGVAFANQSYFSSQAKSSVATTTIAFMTPGTATTTVLYDSYQQFGTNETSSYTPRTTDGSALLIQFTATTTTSVLGWRYEYSDDGVDWYGDSYVPTISNATTTGTQSLTNINQYTWTFSSSTNFCDSTVSTATNNRGCKVVNVQTPTRYVRAVFFLPTGSSNGAVYAQFVPRKQAN